MYTKMVADLNDINKDFQTFLKVLPEDFDKVKITKAFEFSKKAHIYQTRFTGEPYVSHPLEVSKIVNSLGLDETSIICALLHDVVEDTEITIEKIKEEFGEEAEMIVEGLTKITTFGRKSDEGDIGALRKILLASSKDIRILIIKLCDRLHNLRTLEELPKEKRMRVAKETLNIYVPIAQKVGMYSLKWELEDLSLKYRNPDMYQHIKNKLNLKRGEREDIVEQAVKEIKEILEVNGINAIVLGRPKNFYSIYKKIRDKAKSFEEIFDLYAVRVILKDVSECYTALGILHEKFQAFPDRLRDYIANPKSNGYQSIHTILFSRRIKCPVEVQVRTEEMHKLAEFGVAAHWRYKNINEDKKFEKRISWLREVLEWEKEHKDNAEFLKLLKFDFFEDEIFVFTPRNEVILLPEGASAIDFAYSIHTELGNKAFKAKINGCLSTIDKELKNGDIVDIITNRSAKPSDKWLKFAKTTKARIKIRNFLEIKGVSNRKGQEGEVFFDNLISKINGLDKYKKVKNPGCCKVEFSDQLIGVEGKNKSVSVHNASCDNSKYALESKVSLSWKEEKEKEISLDLRLHDRVGLLMDMLNIFASYNLSIRKMNSKVARSGIVEMKVTLLDGPYVQDLTKSLKKMTHVESVSVSRGLLNDLISS